MKRITLSKKVPVADVEHWSSKNGVKYSSAVIIASDGERFKIPVFVADYDGGFVDVCANIDNYNGLHSVFGVPVKE